MDRPRSRGRSVLRHLAAPALALAVVTTLPAARTVTGPAAPPAEFKPVTVSYGQSHGGTRTSRLSRLSCGRYSKRNTRRLGTCPLRRSLSEIDYSWVAALHSARVTHRKELIRSFQKSPRK